MASSWRLVVLMVVGFICTGQHRVCLGGDLEEVEARLAALENGVVELQDSMDSMASSHRSEFVELKGHIDDLGQRVNGQDEPLEHLQHALENMRKNSGGQQQQHNNSSGNSAFITGPCLPGNHSLIEDDRRAITGQYDGQGKLCDNDLEPGWYRFMLDDCSAVIPTSCVPEHHCHTDAPTWLNLGDESLPEPGEEAHGQACSHWSGDCCNWSTDMTVRNCGEYFVYYLNPLSACSLAFCTKPQF